MLEAETNQALIETGGRLVVTADHTKWGVTGVSTIAQLSRADVVISDSGLNSEARAALVDQGTEVAIAETHPQKADDARRSDQAIRVNA
jgi:DeoR/GlpR family transcriptional regulator of sugar metabolism